jgi:alkanesulfonate monooxygenase SsuD/methylene tetrahydromethanopterin reductase-like flavin-dependent oxidoreductase (luciferase family)
LAEVLDAVRRLLTGEDVTVRGDHVHLEHARLAWPQPPRRSLEVLVGGNGLDVVRCGARHADIVELTGLGPTLPDGHFHTSLWSARSIDERVEVLGREVGLSGRPTPRLGAFVQHVELTDDREAAAARRLGLLAKSVPAEALPDLDEYLEAPYALVGAEDEIVEQLASHEQRWGFSRYTVREGFDAIGTIIQHPTSRTATRAE